MCQIVFTSSGIFYLFLHKAVYSLKTPTNIGLLWPCVHKDQKFLPFWYISNQYTPKEVEIEFC